MALHTFGAVLNDLGSFVRQAQGWAWVVAIFILRSPIAAVLRRLERLGGRWGDKSLFMSFDREVDVGWKGLVETAREVPEDRLLAELRKFLRDRGTQ